MKPMPTPRLQPALLLVPLLVPACVREQDLGDPAELLTASGSGDAESGSGDDAGSVSATSTTGADACASNTGTRSLLSIHAGPDDDPQLSGFEDVVFSPAGEVSITFIQGNHTWAQIDTAGEITFGTAPGTLEHVGVLSRDASNRHLVAMSSFYEGDEWLQLTGADGSVMWSAAAFDGPMFNALANEALLLADGTSLAHAYWYSDGLGYSRLLHFDVDGAEISRADAADTSMFSHLVEGAAGEVWGLRGNGAGVEVVRFAAGDYTTPTSAFQLEGRVPRALAVDSNQRPVVASYDLDYEVPPGTETQWLDVLDRDTGSTVFALDSATTPGFEHPWALATGACGEIFVIGGTNTGNPQSWVASVDANGIIWADVLEFDGAAYGDVADDGTLVVIGQTTVPDAAVLTIGPWMARYEP